MSTDQNLHVAKFDHSEIVSAARQLYEILPASTASAATKAGYKRELERLVASHRPQAPADLWSAITTTTRSKRTFYRRLAAVKQGMKAMLEEALSTNRDRGKVLEFILGLHKIIEAHRGFCPLEQPRPRHSKRQDMGGLPATWREMVFDQLRAVKSRYQRAYLVAAVSGCRPAELEAGVTVTASKSSLCVRIAGAKVKEQQGQPTREIRYSIAPGAHPLVAMLHGDVWANATREDAGERMIEVSVGTARGFGSAVERAGRKLWPRRKSTIRPYSLRHQAGSDWKAVLTEEQVSLALGHLSSATKRFYGQRQMSKGGGLLPSAVSAARPLRRVSKQPPRPRQHS